jgi:hypothetical protein
MQACLMGNAEGACNGQLGFGSSETDQGRAPKRHASWMEVAGSAMACLALASTGQQAEIAAQ